MTRVYFGGVQYDTILVLALIWVWVSYRYSTGAANCKGSADLLFRVKQGFLAQSWPIAGDYWFGFSRLSEQKRRENSSGTGCYRYRVPMRYNTVKPHRKFLQVDKETKQTLSRIKIISCHRNQKKNIKKTQKTLSNVPSRFNGDCKQQQNACELRMVAARSIYS